jgi:dTDP-4-amino-4,6-dideoxygalactose transaminase
LDEIQAAILRVKLRYLNQWEQARRKHAAEYTKLLQRINCIKTPDIPDGYEHVFHQYTLRVPRRNELQKCLSERKIGSAVYYPVPLHLQPIYASLGHGRGSFPEAELAADEVLSLPMFPELKSEQIQRVADVISEFFSR